MKKFKYVHIHGQKDGFESFNRLWSEEVFVNRVTDLLDAGWKLEIHGVEAFETPEILQKPYEALRPEIKAAIEREVQYQISKQ